MSDRALKCNQILGPCQVLSRFPVGSRSPSRCPLWGVGIMFSKLTAEPLGKQPAQLQHAVRRKPPSVCPAEVLPSSRKTGVESYKLIWYFLPCASSGGGARTIRWTCWGKEEWSRGSSKEKRPDLPRGRRLREYSAPHNHHRSLVRDRASEEPC